MGEIIIRIKTGNAAMKDTYNVGKAVRTASTKIIEHRKLKSIRDENITDRNGNKVGSIDFTK